MSRASKVRTLLLAACAVGSAQCARAQDILIYKGRCDASAATALNADHFIVANDERNKLQIYKRGQPDQIEPGLDASAFLGATKEVDLEGAATIGNRIYWITSHGRNKEGDFQERRHRFFATDIQPSNPPSAKLVGRTPYAKLLNDMLGDAKLKPLLTEASKLAPEAPGGLNIEGLATTLNGKQLLIGFRNPIPADGALIVTLENPDELFDDKPAKFGPPVFLKGLAGMGVRSLERIGPDYLVVAGPPADSGSFALHRWSGKPEDAAVRLEKSDFKGLRPEAMFAFADGDVQVLSDDGGETVDGTECKKLDEAKQRFRSLIIKP